MSNKILKFNFFLKSIFLVFWFCQIGFCAEIDTLTSGLILRDPDTLVSPGKIFRLGFFSPDNTKNRYLGVFYNVSQSTVVWIANRDDPLADSSGSVTISSTGNIVLMNGQNQTVWSSNVTNSSVSASAQLLDTGNVVLRNTSNIVMGDNSTVGQTLWESFGRPSQTFLPTMKIIDDLNTRTKVYVSSWKSPTDPALGDFTAGLDASKIPQIVTWRGDRPHWRSGPWNGLILIGVQDMYSPYLDGFTVENSAPGNFYFTAPTAKFLMKIELNSTGSLVQTLWDDDNKKWDITWLSPQNICDVYGTCGPFGVCDQKTSPICSCLKGFEPVNKAEWESGNWTGGCVRRKPLQCGSSNGTNNSGGKDGFLRMPFMKVPDFAEQWFSQDENVCRTRCSRNCSCMAYAHDSRIGCLFWSDSLVDIQQFSGVGPDLYVRLESSELGAHKDKKLAIIIPIVVGVVVIFTCAIIFWWFMAKKKGSKEKETKKLYEAGPTYPSDSTEIVLKDDGEKVNIEELPLFSFETLANATDQFNDDNMLGKGGFGPVYRGKLESGDEVAVKRLSAASGQGVEEFMNEVVVISKLQHRNLVRLLGCCVEKEEKMLVYEYMPNKSLDVFLFDPSHPSTMVLDWKKRFGIIEGIGRGILYLHRDSRLRIIHRDLKPSNVLLDEDWNPKISDFGMARIFGGNQDQANTGRVVGTYGYMAPEYAMEGRFSEKSDVYSFGVLILELVSGKKNTHFYNQEFSLSLLGFAWKLWNEDNGSAFADPNIASANFQGDVMRCIHIALLCVQEFPENRPTISTALSMLSREILDLPLPEQPVFAEKWNRTNISSQQSQMGTSVNDVTLTMLDGR